MQFENSIIETKYSLHRKFKNYMKVNKDLYVIDLGLKIPIYDHYIKQKINIEEKMKNSKAASNTEVFSYLREWKDSF